MRYSVVVGNGKLAMKLSKKILVSVVSENIYINGHTDTQTQIYRQCFSEEHWRKVTVSERKKHQVINCTQCPSNEQFRLKKSNLEFSIRKTPQHVSSPQTPSQTQVKITSGTPNSFKYSEKTIHSYFQEHHQHHHGIIEAS